MKSPITGKKMKLTYEWRTVPFRKEQFEIPYQFYLCEDTGEQFTTTDLDEWNMQVLHNQFRAKHHIPQPDEMVAIRQKYVLSASRMGEILGFGPNTYGQYEKGEVPGLPNANLVKIAKDPEKFYDLAKDWENGSEKVKIELLKRIEKLIQQAQNISFNFEEYLMGQSHADQFTGYRQPEYNKLVEMIVYFAHETPCYKTKMNKLLFYADFGLFRERGCSISGTRYRAIARGPVPFKYQSVFESLAVGDVIDMESEEMPDGSEKQLLFGRKDRPFNPTLFSESELSILVRIKDRFRDKSPTDIVNISHEESGWRANKNTHSLISYHYALDLKAL